MPVEECAIMDFTGFFRDPAAERHSRWNMRAETNYFYLAVVGELTYSQAHSHCKGTFGSICLEVQLGTDWDTHTCFKELLVWVKADKPHQSL